MTFQALHRARVERLLTQLECANARGKASTWLYIQMFELRHSVPSEIRVRWDTALFEQELLLRIFDRRAALIVGIVGSIVAAIILYLAVNT